MDGAQLSMTSAPHHTVVKAASESVFSGTILPQHLRQELHTQTMMHLQTKEQRLMSVRMWMHFLHLRGSPAEDALLETYPCFRMMIQATGQKALEQTFAAIAWGTGRWCQQCETALSLLGKCGLAPLITDMWSALLAVSGEAWSNGSTEQWSACSQQEPIVCGPNCPFAQC